MPPLPEPNQLVTLVLEGSGARVRTRIEDVEEGVLVAARPTDDEGTPVTLAPGERVTVEWSTDRGLCRLAARYDGFEAREVPVVLLGLLGEPELNQRRGYVRCPLAAKVEVEPLAGDAPAVVGETIDVSGGGLRAHLPGLAVELNEECFVALELEEGRTLEATARVARLEGHGRFGLEFTTIADRDRERLIAAVFAAMRRQRAL